MAKLNKVNITKEVGSLGALAASEDHISGLIANVAAAPSGLALNTSLKLTKLKDAEDKGITAAYDSTNNELLHWNISEFFRINPTGTLWIILYAEDTTPAVALADSTNTHAKKLIVDAEGKIRQLGVYINPAGYAAGDTDGLKAEARAAIAAGQTFADWTYTTNRPLHVIVEGCGLDATFGSVLDCRDAGGDYPNVSVVIAMDYEKSQAHASYNERAAVGTLLGMISRIQVMQSVGYVAECNIQDIAASKWLTPGLSNGNPMTDHEDDESTIDSLGFIFCVNHGIEGVYFQDDHTCVDEANDEHMIYFSRTKAKASRILRASYLPLVKKDEFVDPDTGFLPTSVIAAYESRGERALDTNMRGEISGRGVTVDPESDLLGAKLLEVEFEIVPKGIVGSVAGKLSLTNKLS